MSLSVLYGCDDNYAPYTGVSMTSLFENNRDEDDITVYLAAMDFSGENLEKFRKTAHQYGRTLVLLDTEEAVRKMRTFGCGTWNGSIAAWLRFFVLDQIPEEVDRLIWLDSDTIVNSELRQVLDTKLEDCPVAAVCDCLCYRHRYSLGLKENEPYFNSGVIVFNLSYWRAHGTVDELMRHLASHAAGYQTPDQDMMNVFFRGNIVRLPPRYNVQCFLMAYRLRDYFAVYPWAPDAYYARSQLSSALEQPVVVHFFRFLGDYPWTQGRNYHPAKALYEKWKSKSLWADHVGAAPKRELAFRAEKLFYRLLPRRWFLRFFAWYTNRGLPRAGT